MAVELNIEVPRQGDFVREYTLADTNGDPHDLNGATIDWDAREVAGQGAVIASATITIIDAITGTIEAKWHGPDFDAVGEPTEIVRVAHDMKLVLDGGDIDVPIRGQINLMPEVTS